MISFFKYRILGMADNSNQKLGGLQSGKSTVICDICMKYKYKGFKRTNIPHAFDTNQQLGEHQTCVPSET